MVFTFSFLSLLFQDFSLLFCSSVYNILLVLFVLMVLKTMFPFNCVFKLNFLVHCFCMCFKNFFRWKYIIANTTFLMLVWDMFYEWSFVWKCFAAILTAVFVVTSFLHMTSFIMSLQVSFTLEILVTQNTFIFYFFQTEDTIWGILVIVMRHIFLHMGWFPYHHL